MKIGVLKLENFLSYPEASVDFGTLGNPLLIVGRYDEGDPGDSNGTGKSSIFEAIRWALYGVSRYKSDDELVRQGTDKMSVSCTFEIEGVVYEVVRSKKVGKSQTLLLSDLTNDKKLRGNSVKETQAKIVAILGMEYGTFSNTIYSGQHELDSFPSLLPSQRKEVLSAILGIGDYAVLEEKARLVATEAESQVRSLEDAVSRADAELLVDASVVAELESLENEIAAVASGLAAARERQSEAQRAVESARSRAAARDRVEKELTREQESLKRLDSQRLGADAERDAQLCAIDADSKRLSDIAAREPQARSSLSAAEASLAVCDSADKALAVIRAERAAAQAVLDGLRKSAQEASRDEQTMARLAQQRAYAEGEKVRQHKAIDDEAASLAALVARGPQVRSVISELEAKVRSYDEVAQKVASLREERSGLSVGRDAVRREVAEMEKELGGLRERLAATEGLGSKCPTCWTELTDEARAKIKAGIIAEGTAKRVVFDARAAALAQADQRLLQIGAEERSLGAAVAGQGELQRDLQGYRDELSRVDMAAQQSDGFGVRRAAADSSAASRLGEIAAEESSCRSRLAASSGLAAQVIAAEKSLLEIDGRARAAAGGGESRDSLQLRLDNLRSELAQVELAKGQAGLADANRKAVADAHARRVKELEAVASSGLARSEALRQELLPIASAGQPEIDFHVAAADLVGADVRRLSDISSSGAVRLGALRARKEARDRKLEQVALDRRVLGESRDTAFTHRELARAFSPKGVPALILDNSLAEIQVEINTIMEELTGGRVTVEFSTQKELKSGSLAETLDIIVSDELGSRDYVGYSGGEAARVALAIRLSLAKVISRRAGKRICLVMIDEVGDLDASGAAAFAHTINSLSRDHQILVVSHDEALKSGFQNVLPVWKGRDGSYIKNAKKREGVAA